MRINFDFTDLEAFLAIIESGSFQAAAERLSVSQSAITRRLQKLEAALDTRLFERSTRRLHPTLAARVLQGRAELILAEARGALHEFGDRSRRGSLVTVATVPTLAESMLPAAIAAFESDGQRARISIVDGFAGDAIDATLSGEADFGLGFVGIREPGLRVDVLGEDEFVLVVRRDNPLARRRRIRWREIGDEPLIVPAKGVGNRLLIDHAMAAERLELDWKYQARRSSTTLNLVASGIGVGVLPASALPRHAESPVVAITLTRPRVARTVGVFHLQGKRMSPAALAFYRILASSPGPSGGPAPAAQ